jgi:hypothetical protein
LTRLAALRGCYPDAAPPLLFRSITLLTRYLDRKDLDVVNITNFFFFTLRLLNWPIRLGQRLRARRLLRRLRSLPFAEASRRLIGQPFDTSVHKWVFPANWKFAAENFLGDTYHNPSHRSVDLIGIGPSAAAGKKGRRDDELQLSRGGRFGL